MRVQLSVASSKRNPSSPKNNVKVTLDFLVVTLRYYFPPALHICTAHLILSVFYSVPCVADHCTFISEYHDFPRKSSNKSANQDWCLSRCRLTVKVWFLQQWCEWHIWYTNRRHSGGDPDYINLNLLTLNRYLFILFSRFTIIINHT